MHTMILISTKGAKELQTIYYIEILKALRFRCKRHDMIVTVGVTDKTKRFENKTFIGFNINLGISINASSHSRRVRL